MTPYFVNVGDYDLGGEMIIEDLPPFPHRLVIPIEERYVGDLPAAGSEKVRFDLCRTVDDVVAG